LEDIMKQSHKNRLDRSVAARTPKPQMRFIWVDWDGPSFEEKRDARIAAGTALPTDEFVKFSWLPPLPDQDS
jgi:hypothetical protein